MWTFAGLLVLTVVVWAELRRIGRYLATIGYVFVALANRNAEKAGEEPVVTPEDVKSFTV